MTTFNPSSTQPPPAATASGSEARNKQDDTLPFPPSHRALIAPYLPPAPENDNNTTTTNVDKGKYPFLTLTYASSLDASIALVPGQPIALSSRHTYAMTHFLRSRHDAVLVGAGTAEADDPRLNSRLRREEGDEGPVRQPRPVVLDARARWKVGSNSRVIQTAWEGKGLGPWVFVSESAEVEEVRVRAVEEVGGRYVRLPTGSSGRLEWADVLLALAGLGIRSVMVEGGGEVINSLLVPPGRVFVDAVVVTIAPVWLGKGGVVASPPRVTQMESHGDDNNDNNNPAPLPLRLTDVRWCPMGEDVVMCGRMPK
ncbi:hypothetical protein VTJ49DRAFT_6132 [Mycothermus thermophilus]|uniref:2,5-diamino-6-ribosylamino-4(3H)-pyrimidinone 5'-phosphate reductase n=1 Tax=Humicola insolens TaxID=85995 RepID=A0ABR3VJZ9_HUMIN